MEVEKIIARLEAGEAVDVTNLSDKELCNVVYQARRQLKKELTIELKVINEKDGNKTFRVVRRYLKVRL